MIRRLEWMESLPKKWAGGDGGSGWVGLQHLPYGSLVSKGLMSWVFNKQFATFTSSQNPFEDLRRTSLDGLMVREVHTLWWGKQGAPSRWSPRTWWRVKLSLEVIIEYQQTCNDSRSKIYPAPPLLNSTWFGGKNLRPINIPFFCALASKTDSELFPPTMSTTKMISSLPQEVSQIADDVIHVVSSDQKPVELIFVVASNIFPNASRLLPHVIVLFWTFVMDLDRYRGQ